MCLLIFTCSAQTNADTPNNIENNLKNIFKIVGEPDPSISIIDSMNKTNLPGLSVAVIHKGKIDWAKGYGIANATSKVSTDTLFQAASISKPVAALAALKLVEQGKLKLDVDVNQYLKGWKVEGSQLTKENPVTLRHLLTHNSGINVPGFPGYATGSKLPSTIDILSGKGNTHEVEVNQLPGKNWRYSGGGYTVIQKIVEDITGLSFSEYADNQILKPMGMTSSTFKHVLPMMLKLRASAAYDQNGKMYPAIYNDYPEKAAAGLWTTPSDLALYVMHMQSIIAGKTDGILKKSTVESIFIKHQGDWGLGPSIRHVNNHVIFGHDGKNLGFTNDFNAFVNEGEGIIVMSNGDSGSLTIMKVMMAISKYYEMGMYKRKSIDVFNIPLDKLKQFTGKYKMSTNIGYSGDYIVDIRVIDETLQFKAPGEESFSRLYPVEEEKFIEIESKFNPYVFHKNDVGGVIGITLADKFKFEKIR